MTSFEQRASRQRIRGPIDGRKFFSESPLRSGYFLVLSAICLCGVVYALYLVLSHLHAGFKLMVFVFIGTGFVYSWLEMVEGFKRVRAAQADTPIDGAEAASPLNVALGAAAWGPLSALFYCYSTMILMEFIIGRLMTHAGL